MIEVLKKKLDRLRSYLKANGIEAYRLYNGSESSWPLAIDIYYDSAVIHVFDLFEGLSFKILETWIKKVVPVKYFFYKDRTKEGVKLPGAVHREIDLKEYGHFFHCNLSDYLDTGLFLDHRETRRWIASRSKGKIVLNTFAYTGAFSVYAAAGGAEKTYSVDLSRTYCAWIKRNLRLNNLPEDKNWIYKMDTMEFFAYAGRKGLKFDIIIIDPPTFSKNKGRHFSVMRDHPALINAALPLLKPKGFILFSTNRKEFKLKASSLKSRDIQEKRDTYPPDFAGAYPHKCYLISQ
jgi:23S rRNA (cytosine1962-C5)-methyltransferase